MSTEANIKSCKEVFEEKSFFCSEDHYDVMANTFMFFFFTLLGEFINTAGNNGLRISKLCCYMQTNQEYGFVWYWLYRGFSFAIFKLGKFAYYKALFLAVFGCSLTSQNWKWKLMVKGPIYEGWYNINVCKIALI